MSQSDLFGHTPPQGDLFADAAPPPRPTRDFPTEARFRLLVVLDQARAAPARPWPEREMRTWEVLFPQMSGWLPEDEARQLCFEFAREVERLKRAA